VIVSHPVPKAIAPLKIFPIPLKLQDSICDSYRKNRSDGSKTSIRSAARLMLIKVQVDR
jgi:hypothetical protein